MRYPGGYFKLNIKRMINLLPGVILMIVCLAVAVFLLGYTLIGKDSHSDEKQKINIAIAGDFTQGYLGLSIETVSKIDSSSYAVNYITMSENEAKEALKKGEITAYVVVPENYVDNVDNGVFVPVEYATNNDLGLTGKIIEDMTDVLSKMISESNSSIISTGVVSLENGEDFGKVTDAMLLKIAGIILDRESLYEIKQIGVSSGLGFPEYISIALLILFSMLMQLSVAPFFRGRTEAYSRILLSKGLSVRLQILAEFISCQIFLVSFSLVMGVILFCAFGMMSFWMISKMLLISLAIGGVSFLAYEVDSASVSGLLIQLFISVGIGFMSGCFFPHSFFPDLIQKLTRILYPVCGIHLLGSTEFGVGTFVDVVVLAGILVGSVAGSVYIRKRRIS